jgi:hypothetical protein
MLETLMPFHHYLLLLLLYCPSHPIGEIRKLRSTT